MYQSVPICINLCKDKAYMLTYSLATGSPWHIEVRNTDHVVTTACPLGCLPINTVASFEVNTRDDEDVQVDINGLFKFHAINISLNDKVL